MQYVIVGILDSYRDAEAAVQDLELAGIVGEQVEVISDIDEDVRTANTPDEPSTTPHKPHHNWIARLFGAGGPLEKREVRDVSGEQPNYIGEGVLRQSRKAGRGGSNCPHIRGTARQTRRRDTSRSRCPNAGTKGWPRHSSPRLALRHSCPES